jgi:recombinational DNA repair protein (RecF pathway)
MPEPCATCQKPVPPAAAALCRRALGRVLCHGCRERPDPEPDEERPFYWEEPWAELAAEHEALEDEE